MCNILLPLVTILTLGISYDPNNPLQSRDREKL